MLEAVLVIVVLLALLSVIFGFGAGIGETLFGSPVDVYDEPEPSLHITITFSDDSDSFRDIDPEIKTITDP